MIVALVVNGDLYQDYLRHFEYAFDNTSFNLPFKVNGEEMTIDILDTAEKYNIKFFTIARSIEGLTKENVCIFYSDDSVLNNIFEECSVKIKEYKSVIFGKTDVTARPFEESSDELLTGTYYLIGDKNCEKDFKLALMDKYGGSLIRDGYEPNDDKLIVGVIWLAVLIVFVLMTVFEYHISLQLNALTISMGTSVNKLYLINCTIDAVCLTVVLCSSRQILLQFTNTSFNSAYQFCFLVAAIISDVIVYSRLYGVNIGLYLRGKDRQSVALAGCYVVKFAASVLVIVLFASFVAIASEYKSYASQKPFWDKYSLYNNLKARVVTDDDEKDEEESRNIDYKIYSEHFNDSDIVLLSYIAGKDFFGVDVIAFNKNAADYLKPKLKDIDFATLEDNKVYAFIPKKQFKNGFGSANAGSLNEMSDKVIDWSGSYHEGTEIIYYNNSVKLLSLTSDSDFSSKYYKNPIVLFINIDEEKNPRVNTGDLNIGEGQYFKMFNMSKQEYKYYYEKAAAPGEDVQVFYFNIGEQYNYNLSTLRKTVYISLILTALISALNTVITIIFLKIYLNVNSVETALKKVTGYSVFERYSLLFIGIVIIEVLGLIGAGVASIVLKLNSIPFIIAGGMIFIAMDLLVITLIIKHTENERVSKILKGGSL